MTRFREFAKLTWPQVNEAVADSAVALIPVGTIEDHGLHLPLDTDVVIAEGICRRAAALVGEKVVLLPTIAYGFSPHHIDGPGTLTIRWDSFIEYVRQLANSLVYHGFEKILIVNAHGSNRPVLELAARLTVVDNPHAQCAMLSWWDLQSVKAAVASFRESEWTSHACELETSLYLALDPTHVNMSLARKEVPSSPTPHVWSDLVNQPPPGFSHPVSLIEYWSTKSETGTVGDPTVATPEKGEAILAAAAEEIAEIIKELRARPARPRVPHQLPEVQERNRAQRGVVPPFVQ